ncbi:iron chaperone [Chitinophagaceae bacterium LWZ2-11]
MMNKAENIDAYIATFPEAVQILLEKMRTTVKKAAPTAEETISYGMPTFKLHGNLVYFAAYKNHIGFYPTPSGIKAFAEEIAKYKNSKGAVQFPLDKPLPLALITKIVKFRVAECLAKEELRKDVKKSIISHPKNKL